MPSPLFYEKPVLLNRDLHRNRKISPSGSFDFSRRTNSVYLAGAEFSEACKEYPIVFTKVADKLVPAIVVGLRDNENLFVNADGKWGGRYIPAFVRRYPFILADLADGQKGVCIDEAFAGLNSSEGEALFNDLGENTPFLQNALDFLNRFQAECTRTDLFCKRLQDANLLVEMNVKADLYDGSAFVVNGLLVVDEQKMLQLNDKWALELFRSGELSWIYSHLVSLANLSRLTDRLADLKRALV